MDATESVYFVWKQGGNIPGHKHRNSYEAEKEAKRLAELYKSDTFLVLRLVQSIKFRESPFEIKHYSKSGL